MSTGFAQAIEASAVASAESIAKPWEHTNDSSDLLGNFTPDYSAVSPIR